MKEYVVPKEFDVCLQLMKATLLGEEKPNLPDGVDYGVLLKLSRKHCVGALVFRSLSEEKIPEELKSKWKSVYASATKKELLYSKERPAVFDAFRQAKIDFLPLKGIVLRSFYPFATREFSDHDVLIRSEDAKRVQTLMEGLGYQTENGFIHDSYHKEPFFTFEMHKGTVFLPGEEFNGFFDTLWDRSVLVENHEYRLTDEDFVAYNLAHFCKHYNAGGAGLRSFSDFFLMKKNLVDAASFDFSKFQESLEKADLTDFYKFACETTESLFGESVAPIPEDVRRYICLSGVYGSKDNHLKNEIQKSGRLRYLMYHLLPPFGYMKIYYLFLADHPILLPICWVLRWIRILAQPKKFFATFKAVRKG